MLAVIREFLATGVASVEEPTLAVVPTFWQRVSLHVLHFI
jgi:hypothetical protein